MVRWTGLYVLIVGAHVAWRVSYYGSFVPNTFHAKVSGLWVEQGLKYVGLFLGDHILWWLLPVVVVAVVFRRDFTSFLFLSVVTANTVTSSTTPLCMTSTLGSAMKEA